MEAVDNIQQQDPPMKGNQPPPADKTRVLYDAVSKEYNIGTYDEFKGKLQDPAKRKAFYNGVGKQYDLGTFDQFESKLGVKKKDGGGSTPSPSPSPAPSKSPEQANKIPAAPAGTDIFNLNKPNSGITTADGINLPIDKNKAPLVANDPDTYWADVQKRAAKKEQTPQDVEAIANASGKSAAAVQGYLQDKAIGFSVEDQEKVKKNRLTLESSIQQYNKQFGTSFDPQEILSSPEKTADFMNKLTDGIKNKQKQDLQKSQELKADPTGFQFQMQDGQVKGIKNTDALVQHDSDQLLQYADPNSLYSKVKEYESLLKQHIVNTTISDDKKAGISPDKTIVKILQRTDPKGFERSAIAETPKTGLTVNPAEQLGQLADFVFGTKDKDDLLNIQKGEAEILYNKGVSELATNKISEGVLRGDTNLIKEGQRELKGVDNETIYKYPALLKRKIAQEVSQQIAQETGQAKGSSIEGGFFEAGRNVNEKFLGAGTSDYIRIMDKLGYLNDPRTKDAAYSLLAHPSLFSDPSYLGGVLPNFLKPFQDLNLSIGDISGFRSDKDIEADKARDENFPTEGENLKPFAKGVRNIANTTANLAGMAVIAGATEGVATGAGLSATTARSIGAYASFGLPSWDSAYKESGDFLQDKGARTAYASMIAMVNSEGGRLLDLGKITRIPGISEQYAKLAQQLSDKTITEDATRELLDKAKNKYVDFAVKYGQNVTKGAATMAYFNATNNIVKAAFGDPNTNVQDILPKASHAFVDGVLGMSIIGAFGAASDMRNENNTSYKGFIYNMALNHDATADVFKLGLDNGEYSKPEYNQKMNILNAAKSSNDVLKMAEQDHGIELNPQQRAVYVANKTAEASLRYKLENAKDEEVKKKTEQQINNLTEQNRYIFEGLQFNDTLQPLHEVFDAERNYNKAVQDFKDGTISEEGLEKAKDTLVNTRASLLGSASTKDENVVKSTLGRIDNAEYINEKDLDKAADRLYGILDDSEKSPEYTNEQKSSINNLVEPLIQKIEGYDFRTKTETSTVTEKTATVVARETPKREIKPALEQSAGSSATVTFPDGGTRKGTLNIKSGQYVLDVPGADQIVIGEKAITDRDIKLPPESRVENPIAFDEDGNVKSVTLETRNGNLVTIEDPEKALDITIQLRADAVGEVPQADFDLVFNEVQKQVQQEAPVKDISSPKIEKNGNETEKTETGKAEVLVEAGAEKPAPVTKSSDGGEGIGIAHDLQAERADKMKVLPPERGEGLTVQQAVQRGRDLLKNGADANKIADNFFRDGMISSDAMSIVRAKYEQLAADTNKVYDKSGAESKEGKRALAEEREWYNNVVKPMQTEWHKIGMTQQGETNIDTGTVRGLERSFEERTGKPFDKSQAEKAKELSGKVSELSEKNKQLQKELQDLYDKAGTTAEKGKTAAEKAKVLADKIRKGKLSRPDMFSAATLASLVWDGAVEATAKSIEAGGKLIDAVNAGLDHIKKSDWYKGLSDDDKGKARQQFTDAHQPQAKDIDVSTHFANKTGNDFTPQEVKAIWEHAKEKYLDKGVDDFALMINNIAKDTGLSSEQVVKAITQPKGAKAITDQMYKLMGDRRLAVRRAEQWVKTADTPALKKAFQSIPNAFFALTTFGHGTVGAVTHAGMDIYRPSNWAKYFPFVIDQFKYSFGGLSDAGAARYEQAMSDLVNDKDFPFWKRAGLAVDPRKITDDYQGWTRVFGKVGMMGERGFNALKVYRFEQAKDLYSKLSAQEKSDPEIAGTIARMVNLSTGSSDIQFPQAASVVFFAPRLEASKWSRIFSEPSKALMTFSHWSKATDSDKVAAKLVARHAGEMVATMVGLLAANQGMLIATGSKQRINFTNPLDPDWMKFKFGGLELDASGGMISTMRFIGGMGMEAERTVVPSKGKKPGDVEGQKVLSMLRGKLSPFAATGAELISGTDYGGRPLPWSTVKPMKGQEKHTIPSYAWSKAPIPFAEGAKTIYEGMESRGMHKDMAWEIWKGIIVGAAAGGTGARLTPDYSLEKKK